MLCILQRGLLSYVMSPSMTQIYYFVAWLRPKTSDFLTHECLVQASAQVTFVLS